MAVIGWGYGGRRIRGLTGLLVLSLACVAFAGANAYADDTPTGAKGGKIIFRDLCASCHGTEGKGDGPVGASLKIRPADLTAIAMRRGGHFPVDEIAEWIDGRKYTAAHGPREMPVWGATLGTMVKDGVTREIRIADAIDMLVAYLQEIQKP